MRSVLATIIMSLSTPPLATSALAAAGMAAMAATAAPLPAADALGAVQADSASVFGALRENLHLPDAPLALAVAELMGISDEPVELEPQLTLISGCRPQSCQEKSAAIVSPERHLLAAALRHFHCQRSLVESIPTVRCDQQPTLLVYLIHPAGAPAQHAGDAALLRHLERWGKQAGYAHEEVRIIQRSTTYVQPPVRR